MDDEDSFVPNLASMLEVSLVEDGVQPGDSCSKGMK